jgi:hypothetical protein
MLLDNLQFVDERWVCIVPSHTNSTQLLCRSRRLVDDQRSIHAFRQSEKFVSYRKYSSKRRRSMAPQRPSYIDFDKSAYTWKADVDYRAKPQLYRVGKGEQGVLICEPYKSELISHWRFKTPAIARRSSAKLYRMFRTYLEREEFVGADMARKFLQMGYTRARRYANYKDGQKYDKTRNYALRERGTGDAEKAESAAIFHAAWRRAEAEPRYATLKKAWKAKYG